MDIERFQKTKDSIFVPDTVKVQSKLDILRAEFINKIKNQINRIQDEDLDLMLEQCIINDYTAQTYTLDCSLDKYGYIKVNKTNDRLSYNMSFSDGNYESHTLSFDDAVNVLPDKLELYNLLIDVRGTYGDYRIRDHAARFALTDAEISSIYDCLKNVLTNYGVSVVKHKVETFTSDLTILIKVKNPVYNL